MTVGELTRLADRLSRDRQVAQDRKARAEADLSVCQDTLATVRQARDLVHQVADRIQRTVHARVAGVVSRCLEAVGYPYTFAVRFDRKRGRTEARFAFVTADGQDLSWDEVEGGAVELAAFGLRLAVLVLRRPRVRQFLCLDEAFRMVDKDRKHLVRQLVEALARDLGVQVLLITHDPELVSGTVIDLGGD